MPILGKIASKQKRFCIGGREVLFVDADCPVGDSRAAEHFSRIVCLLHDYAERELFPSAADALKRAVSMGLGHRFVRWQYRITLNETHKGRKCFVTLGVALSGAEAVKGDLQFYSLETAWDESGALQSNVKANVFGKKKGEKA